MLKKTFLEKKIAFLVLCSVGLMGSTAVAQTAGLDALGQIQDSQDQRRTAFLAEQNARAAARERADHQAALERMRAAQKAEIARQEQIAREHQDDRQYLDANRQMNLEERRLHIQMEQARANHSDDYAKAELQEQQTQTDIEKTNAKSDQHLKEDVGTAAKMSQRHWWEKD